LSLPKNGRPGQGGHGRQVDSLGQPAERHPRAAGAVGIVVWDKLYERLGPEVMRQWRLRNGEPANFQGDERDLIIISTVVAVNPTIPASRVSAMTGNAAMRRTF
jgi:hypothetical protein